MGAATAYHWELLNILNRAGDVSGLEVAAMFPKLLVGLYAAAGLLVAHRWMLPALIAYMRGHSATSAPAGPGMLPRTRPVLLAWLAGTATTLGVMVFTFHFFMASSLGVAEMAKAWTAVAKNVDTWVDDQLQVRRSAFDTALKLQEHDQWTLSAPNDSDGLAILIPNLDRHFKDWKGSDLCRMQVGAGTVDIAELRDMSGFTGEQQRRDVTYCIRISCPAATLWPSPPSVLLWSSHPSRNRFWLKTLYADVFGRGRAAEPGGFCTAEGELADDYQG